MKTLYTQLSMVAVLFAAPFFTSAQIDLSIGNISAGYEYDKNTGIIKEIYFTLLSNENTGASDFKVGVFFVPPGVTTLDNSYLLSSVTVPSIGGNASKDVTNWTIDVNKVATVPPDGNYRLMVFVDYEKAITETDETNNGLFISKQGEDLTFKASQSTGLHTALQGLNAVSVYPNPAKQMLKIDCAPSKIGDMRIEVKDVTGKIINSNSFFMDAGMSSTNLDISVLTAGCYFIELTLKNQVKVIKFVKE